MAHTAMPTEAGDGGRGGASAIDLSCAVAPTFDAAVILTGLRQLPPKQLCAALADFLPKSASADERTHAIEDMLRSPAGRSLREAMARWIVGEIVPVERLVPEAYVKWRPPVRDAMTFVVARLSAERLAPKLLEQIELAENTSAEERLLRLIAKVPRAAKVGSGHRAQPASASGSEKCAGPFGKRNSRRKARGHTHDHSAGSGAAAHAYGVEISPVILSEASVSAVVRFTWRNPESGRRERGVFKVLKPHIPSYFAEDMDYLQRLAQYFGERHHNYGFPPDLIADTFRKVRRLLRHEVNFVREQKTLVEAGNLYRSMSGVRVPQLIRPLCTPRITALTEEYGIKVTNAAARLSAAGRRKIAEQLIEALVAVPLLSVQKDAIFHGDPHAGNLLYNNRTGELTIIDWALRERLSREQRRHLALLFLMVSLRDPVGTRNAIAALSQRCIPGASTRERRIGEIVTRFLDGLPVPYLPSGVDAMRLLESVALKGVKFSGALIMLSKVMVTLDGILGDIGGGQAGLSFAIARQVAEHWIANREEFRSPLLTRDWITLQCSAALYPSRIWLKAEQALVERWLAHTTKTQSASA